MYINIPVDWLAPQSAEPSLQKLMTGCKAMGDTFHIYKRKLPLTLSQWSSSGNPVAIQCAWNLDPSVHWNATRENILVASVLPVVFQWLSSGLPVCSNYAN